MTRLQLSSSARTDFRKSETKRLRREGRVPATIYGKGFDPSAVTVVEKELQEVLASPGGRLSLIDLSVDGKESKAHPVMIQAMQIDPLSKHIVHLDFHRVTMSEPIHASVPVILVGEAPGVKQRGTVELITSNLDIRALPDHMPTHIDVDISHLELGQSIHVREVQIPGDCELLGPVPENVVVTVRVPTVHIEETPAAEEGAPAEEQPAPAE